MIDNLAERISPERDGDINGCVGDSVLGLLRNKADLHLALCRAFLNP